MSQGFRNRFPTYDVLDKWDTPSWNDQTRAVVAQAAARSPDAAVLQRDRMGDLAQAICDRLIPQPDRPDDPVPIVPFIDEKLFKNQGNGYRYEEMPPMREAWRHRPARDRRGGACPLAAAAFASCRPISRTRCCARCSTATRCSDAWQGMPPKRFFEQRAAARGGRASITRTRRPGARSALAARPRRAAMSGSASTGAIRGRQGESSHER